MVKAIAEIKNEGREQARIEMAGRLVDRGDSIESVAVLMQRTPDVIRRWISASKSK